MTKEEKLFTICARWFMSKDLSYTQQLAGAIEEVDDYDLALVVCQQMSVLAIEALEERCDRLEGKFSND